MKTKNYQLKNYACIVNSSSPVFLSSFTCVSTCPNSTYENSLNYTCSSCQSPCEYCISANSCSTCLPTFYLYNNNCNSICPSGYVGVGRVCQPCTNNCKTCFGLTSYCLSCLPNTYLYNTTSPTCVSTCLGLYINIISQSCTGCKSPCLTCQNLSTFCLTCSSGYLFNGTCLTNCNLGYY